MVLNLRAFTLGEIGGNPAGVVLDADPDQDAADMMATAARVGHSETVFVLDGPPRVGQREYTVRYFSPEAEVPFCGHATVAVGAALGQRIGAGDLRLRTGAGPVDVRVAQGDAGSWTTTLTSPPPTWRPVADSALEAALAAFGWGVEVLDPRIPAAEIYAGAWHLLVPVVDRSVLATMAYDFAALRRLSVRNEWVTVHLAHMVDERVHVVRAPFPFGGVVEDPATGAGAAAYAAYLRDIGVIHAPIEVTVHQGQDMGMPCLIRVEVDHSCGPVRVSGEVTGLP
jgi:PhzF family phenazine biosynthesis protein